MIFRHQLKRGHIGRIENPEYLKWVKTLPCVVTEMPADDPHHLIGHGYGSTGSKASDYWTIPVTRIEHNLIHNAFGLWEQAQGSQFEHVALTLLQAIHEGKLRWVG